MNIVWVEKRSFWTNGNKPYHDNFIMFFPFKRSIFIYCLWINLGYTPNFETHPLNTTSMMFPSKHMCCKPYVCLPLFNTPKSHFEHHWTFLKQHTLKPWNPKTINPKSVKSKSLLVIRPWFRSSVSSLAWPSVTHLVFLAHLARGQICHPGLSENTGIHTTNWPCS